MIFEARVVDRVTRVEVRPAGDRYVVLLDDRALEVDFLETGPGFASLILAGQSYDVGLETRPGGFTVSLGRTRTVVDLGPASPAGVAPRHGAGGPFRLVAPMPGKVVRVLAAAGATIEAGVGLVVVEAMKMENELRSHRSGTVKEVHVREGQTVETGALLVVVE